MEHVVVAVQEDSHRSGKVAVRRIHVHTGWVETPSGRFYLHAGGAIGANGITPDLEVSMREQLSRFELPPPPQGQELLECIRSLSPS